jgi:PAS domain S-box-containing protein
MRVFKERPDHRARALAIWEEFESTKRGPSVVAKLAEWTKQAGRKTSHLHRLNIGPRLTLCFIFIILTMLVGDAILLWQFHRAREQAERLSGVDQELIVVLQAHTSLMSFYEKLDTLADSEDTERLVREAESSRNALLQDSRRSRNVLSRLPPEVQLDPTLLPTLEAIQDALPAELAAITELAKSRDWQAVRLRLANQIRPLESRTSNLVENIDREVGEKRAQALLKIAQAQRRILLIVPLTAGLTLLFAALLGLAITRSITMPLGRLMEGSKALAGGDFSHRVPAAGRDEIARVGSVFNDMIARLQELYGELQSREAYLAEAQKLSHTGSFGWDHSSGEISWSRETFRIFEYDLTTQVTIEQILRRTHPEDREAVRQIVERVSRDRTAFDFEQRLLMPGGSVKYLRVVGHPSRVERGSFEVVGAVTDITERKRADEALRRSEGYLAEAERLTGTGSWAWDVSSRKGVYWSQENYRLFGFDPEAGIPSDEAFYQRVHPEDRDRVRREVFVERPHEGSNFDVEFRIVLPGGAVKYIRSTGHSVRNLSGDLLEFVGTSIDVTERKQADEERERLRQAQADLAHLSRVTTMGELAASLAHEIRQPISAALTNARTCLRWLGRNEPDVPEAGEAASRLIKDVTRAADIIGRVSSLFKKDALQREPVDVNEIIKEMIVLLRTEASRYSISIRTELAEDLPKIIGDRVQLQQVFMNLMLNGIDAMKEINGGSELAIKSETDDGQLLISVSDTGVGLPLGQGDRIFRAFFTTKDNGTGMGLPISRSIIESHGGRLWATGASGRGATFQFTLPTTDSAHL